MLQNERNGCLKANGDSMFNKIVILISIAFGFALLAIMILINDQMPNPYMDEIFHVKQTQTYCKGNFSYWNPKITTPPGLYLTTLGFLKPFSELYAFGEDDETKICPVVILRLMNVIFMCANNYLMYLITVQLHRFTPKTSKMMLLLSSVSLSTLPPLFFFSFLYYTDPGSLFFVLLMYMFHVNNYEWLASLFGAISLLYRQTNIVWIFLLAAHKSFKLLNGFSDKSKRKSSLLKSILQTSPQIMTVCGGYVLVAIAFVIFLIYNNGIVLGDRVSHEAVLHLAQIPYFLGFVAFFAFPWIFTPNNIKKFIAITMKYPLKMMSAFILMAVILKKFSYVHPYLLADNRHYTFYIWKRILGRDQSLLPYAVIPIYVFTAVTMFHLLQRKDSYWKCLFVLCTSISIVPQKLLELRYFIVAFVIWRINIAPTNPTILSLELALYTLVNAFTIYMFAFYTFKWHDSNDLQRIMW